MAVGLPEIPDELVAPATTSIRSRPAAFSAAFHGIDDELDEEACSVVLAAAAAALSARGVRVTRSDDCDRATAPW